MEIPGPRDSQQKIPDCGKVEWSPSKYQHNTQVNSQPTKCFIILVFFVAFLVESQRNDILFALSHIEEHTCIRFKELRDPNQTCYLMFFKGAG